MAGATVQNAHPNQSSGSIGGQIVIGAGCSALIEQALTHLGPPPADVFWVGPNAPSPGKTLKTFLADNQSRHLPGLPGDAEGEGELILYNLPGLVSLSEPLETLFHLFPGLRETSRQRFDWLEPAKMGRFLADMPDPVTIWIDLPGAESTILESLARSGLLARARFVHLRCGTEPFFTGASGQADIERKLGELGFELDSIDDSDPDFPILYCQAKPQNDRGSAGQVASTVIHSTTAAQGHADLSEPPMNAEAQGKLLEDARAALAAREKAQLDAEARIELAQRELQRMRQTMADRDEAVARLSEDLRQTRTGLNRALQTVSLQQADLADIQRRYALLVEDRERLERLLEDLTPRLREAAEHLRALSISHEATDQEAPGAKSVKASGKRRKRKS